MPHRRQLLAASSTDAVAKLRDTQHRNDPFRCTFTPPLWPVHHAEDHVVAASCICFFRNKPCNCCQCLRQIIMDRYKVPVHSVWPPVLWSEAFRRPLRDFAAAAADRRAKWVQRFGFSPRAIFLFAGRWSAEKRIHLLIDAMPQDCGLIIVGDSDADYADEIEASGSFCLMAFCQAHMTGKVRITSINRRKPNE